MFWEDQYLAGIADEWYRDPQFHAAETIKTAETDWKGTPWDKIADQIGKVGGAATDFWIQQRQINLLSEQQKQQQKQQQQQQQQQVPMSFTGTRPAGGFDTTTVLLSIGALAAIGLTILFLTKRRP